MTGQGNPIAVGSPAELTLYDPAATRVFGRVDLAGTSTNSPYLSMTLPGEVRATFHRGYATVLDGAVRSSLEIAGHASGVATHG